MSVRRKLHNLKTRFFIMLNGVKHLNSEIPEDCALPGMNVPVTKCEGYVPPGYQFKRLLLVIAISFLMFSGTEIIAQEKMSYKTADSLTYRLYAGGNWKELIYAGKESIRQGHDYYYLRMRIGIAYYQLGRYRAAAVHFEEALNFYSDDKTAIGYLQQCYDWAGMNTEAAYLSKRFPRILLGSDNSNKFFRELFLLSGVSFSDSESKLPDLNIAGTAAIYGEVNMSGDMVINQAGANISPRPDLSWFIGYTNIHLGKYQRIVASGMDTVNNKYTLRQHQVYASFPIRYAKGWQTIPAVNLISINDKAVLLSYDSLAQKYSSQTGTAIPLNYVFSLKVMKDMPYLSLGPSFAYSRLNFNDQLQFSFDFNVFPFANLNLYSFSRIATNYENGQLRNHFKQTLGGRITDWLWLQGSYLGGEVRNAHDENGLLVFNMAGSIHSRSSATIYFLPGKKITFRIEYSYIQQQDEYLEYTDYINYTLNPVQYNNHQIMGGIKWKL
jgi:tetratricopeptide (TPR) repeat protein